MICARKKLAHTSLMHCYNGRSLIVVPNSEFRGSSAYDGIVVRLGSNGQVSFIVRETAYTNLWQTSNIVIKHMYTYKRATVSHSLLFQICTTSLGLIQLSMLSVFLPPIRVLNSFNPYRSMRCHWNYAITAPIHNSKKNYL